MATKNNEATMNRDLVITRVFDAPRELVWKAWTEPQHLMRWWGPKDFSSPACKIDFRVGGKYHFCMRGPDGKDFWSTGTYLEIVPLERIVCSDSFADEKGNIVSAAEYGMPADFPSELRITIAFEAQGGKTKMILTHAGMPAGEIREMTVASWNQSFDKLTDSLGASGNAYVITRTFDAPRALVWKAWTEAEHMMQWFGPTGTTIPVCKLDFRPGGSGHYCMRMPDGQEMWGKWTYREVQAPEKIVLIQSFSNAAGGVTRHPMAPTWPLETLSTTTLTEKDGKTTLTIVWVPYNASEAERQVFDGAHASMNQGWGGTLDQFAEYLAKAKGK